MDSPETAKTTAITTSSSSDSTAVQDSSIFSYISDLSPIQPVKAAHVAQGFPGLNSPPPVFTSPHINPHREGSFLKRSQCQQSSSAEVSQHDDGGKKNASDPDVPGKSTQLTHGLISCTEKECNTEASAQAQPCCSSGCIDEYLAVPVEVECLNSSHSANLSLKQANDEPQSSPSGLADLKKTFAKLDNYNNIREDVETEADTSPASAELSEKKFPGKSTSLVKLVEAEEKQRGGEGPSSECPDIVSSMFVNHPSKERKCEHTVAQIIQAHEDCGEDAGAISNGPIENTVLHDPGASQHKCGIRRRCLQFEEANLNAIADSPSSSNPTDSITKSRSPATHADSQTLESSCIDLTATSSNRQLIYLPQPINTVFSPRSSGNSPLAISKPSGIGLHLNRIVSAVPIGCSVTARFNLGEKDSQSVQGLKSVSVMTCHLLENIKSSSISSNAVERVSASTEVGIHGTKALMAVSSATCQSPLDMKPLSNHVLSKPTEHCATPHDKRKPNSEHADSFEEFNQQSPKKKRKKASNTTDSEGCKRCNCKRTKCLKLYCDCFAAGIYCAEPCACQGCFNRPEYEDTVLETRQQIESRNPLAFAPKIVQRITESPVNSVEDGNWSAPSSARHKRGCNCKKSMCLKKYCECYQANVGCSDGCRCEGCKNVYGRKEDYGVIKETVSQRANDGSLEDTSDEKLEMMATWKGLSHTELYNIHNLTPLTPSFQCSDHGKDEPKSRFLSKRYLPSPESDLTVLSSYGKSPRSPRSSDSRDMLPNTSKEILDIVPYDPELDHSISERMDQLSPSDDGPAYICNRAPLPDSLPTAMASSDSSKTRDWVSASGVQLCPGSGRLSSGGSLCWRSSPITPMPQLGGTKLLQGLNSDSRLYDILEDDTPEILKDTSTPIKAVKVSSPNRKRVSPPHNRFHELGSSSSGGLRSGRKFILQAVPSFPPLTPCIDAKGSINQNRSDFQDNGSNK